MTATGGLFDYGKPDTWGKRTQNEETACSKV